MKFSTRVTALALTLMILLSGFSITASAEDGLVYGIGFVSASGLNLREQPSTDSPVLATADSGECVVVLGLADGWYHVNYNLQNGYMSADYLTVSTVENAELGYGIVTGDSVNLRSGPSTGHSKVGTVSSGERCYIIGLNQGWYKVLYGSISCYIRSDFLKLSEIPYENRASTNTPQYFRQGKAIGTVPASGQASTVPASGQTNAVQSGSNGSATGAQILAKATEYLGTPYVYGGASPSGFDCSGFTMYIYQQHGYSLPHTATGQWQSGIGTKVWSIGALQPGDLVFFNDPSRNAGKACSHAGIYVGNGQFIHSSSSRSNGVIISDLTSGYYNTYFVGGIHA